MYNKLRSILLFLINILHQPAWRLRHNRISTHTRVERGTFVRDCEIAPYTYIGLNCVLNSVEIGAYSSIASGVQIGGMEHAYWDLSTSCHLTDKSIEGNTTHIGHDVWIGADSIIRQGITIGDGAVVGANSFVNKDVPPYAIVVGSPAKIIKYRFEEQTIAELQKSHYWNYPPPEAKIILQELQASFVTNSLTKIKIDYESTCDNNVHIYK